MAYIKNITPSITDELIDEAGNIAGVFDGGLDAREYLTSCISGDFCEVSEVRELLAEISANIPFMFSVIFIHENEDCGECGSEYTRIYFRHGKSQQVKAVLCFQELNADKWEVFE